MNRTEEIVDNRRLIFSGTDERSDLIDDTEKNKYHVNPLEYKNLFHRGSCTCSTLNPLTEQILHSDIDFEDRQTALSIRAKQADQLKKLFNYDGQDAFGIVFAPSGSDLAFLPPMFSKILYPKKDILLLLTCPEELGSGSQIAYLNKYYAERTQFGEKVEKGDEVNVNYDVNLARLKARNDKGLILNHTEEIKKIIEQNPTKSKIGSLVIGSKSGIEDDISIIPNINKEVLWVVDLCQFRNSKKLVNHLIEMGCMVMITGSKFYMAPPFCGAMLVPKQLCERINQTQVEEKYVEGFDNIFSQYDFSEEFSSLRTYFSDNINEGLLLRWEIAIDEMIRFSKIPKIQKDQIIEDWNQLVSSEINKSQYLELMPHQDRTNQTIISFRVKTKRGTYLNYDELKIFYKETTSKEYDLEGYNKVFFGQPVRYSCGAFLRVAIGAYNIYDLLQQNPATRFDNDTQLMKILDEQAGHFI